MSILPGNNNDDDKDVDHVRDMKKSLDDVTHTILNTIKGASLVTNEILDKSADAWDLTKSHVNDLKALVTDEELFPEDFGNLPGAVSNSLGFLFDSDDDNLSKFNKVLTDWPNFLPFKRNTQIISDVGLFSYPTPSSELYELCKEKNGMAGWDHNGYWRCLFPKAIIPPQFLLQKDLLTKEYAQSCSSTSHNGDIVYETPNNGKFFTGFSAYMDWSSAMRKAQSAERLEKLKEKKKEWVSLLNEKTSEAPALEPAKEVTSTCTTTSFYTTKDGTEKNYTKIRQSFSDGTSQIKRVSKTKHAGDDHFETQESITEYPKTSGWF
ncbi:hypothetical protein BABINDRAFT_163189 [Babjeviella inositovora NRRL Y-12698]|uniref:Mitochondrial peculiar membrane protein 1 n=1 Tax=Babjeviella inositovora NRRL Y-12698 TaxID=984486 RepID=A0A1E3QL38_9ASCO|nr:uncharacterized protein BABINDRAFT_163189 [Babjeviella inositovora NRRL Y-12698]ODQ77802.1 hypothetical protein BABINDRAFT_163189 [Babjeviella inositovora NRRL Y-12698]